MTMVRALVLAAAGCLASAAALGQKSAQESGWYLGGALGQAKFSEWCAPAPAGSALLACEDTDTAWKLLGGYRFNPYVSVEGTYINWGEVTGTVSPPTRDVSAEQSSLGAAVVGSLQLMPTFAVFGKAGFLMTEQTTRVAGSSADREETEFHYGFGARFAFAPNWVVRGEWERTEKLEVEMFSLGAEYRF